MSPANIIQFKRLTLKSKLKTINVKVINKVNNNEKKEVKRQYSDSFYEIDLP